MSTREAQKAERRQFILDAARALILEGARGDFSMPQLAAAAGRRWSVPLLCPAPPPPSPAPAWRRPRGRGRAMPQAQGVRQQERAVGQGGLGAAVGRNGPRAGAGGSSAAAARPGREGRQIQHCLGAWGTRERAEAGNCREARRMAGPWPPRMASGARRHVVVGPATVCFRVKKGGPNGVTPRGLPACSCPTPPSPGPWVALTALRAHCGQGSVAGWRGGVCH